MRKGKSMPFPILLAELLSKRGRAHDLKRVSSWETFQALSFFFISVIYFVSLFVCVNCYMYCWLIEVWILYAGLDLFRDCLSPYLMYRLNASYQDTLNTCDWQETQESCVEEHGCGFKDVMLFLKNHRQGKFKQCRIKKKHTRGYRALVLKKKTWKMIDDEWPKFHFFYFCFPSIIIFNPKTKAICFYIIFP